MTSERMPLDIRDMQRSSKGCGTAFERWHGGGNVYVSFQKSVANVEARIPGQPTQRQAIEMVRTKPTFGGYRNWWKSPCCGSRVGVLYWSSWRWQCRRCAGLIHKSTRQAEDSLAYNRVNKIREKLGWGGGLCSPMGGRPKGMHWRTYARLIQQLNDASLAAAGASADRIDMLTERLLKIRMPK